MTQLTIIYVTNRRQSRLDWFISSLRRERLVNGDPQVDVVVVDHFKDTSSLLCVTQGNLAHVPPKPNVWNGPHRLTKEDWFAAGNSRNTGLCFVRTPWVAFVDDLSVLMPGWLTAALLATKVPGVITCGAYRKVKNLVVDPSGDISFTHFEPGVDNRQRHVDPELSGKLAFKCGGSWLYGCSLVAPLEAFLQVNGWCEDWCGGIGFEDVVTGLVLENAGFKFRYDTRLMTFEAEDLHHVEKPFKKTDKGVSPQDKSHAVLDRVRHLKRFDNFFDLRAMREQILAGQPFPVPTEPVVDWYDQQPIRDM